jgi:polyhydroxyalkanoate synthesis regulator phasin
MTKEDEDRVKELIRQNMPGMSGMISLPAITAQPAFNELKKRVEELEEKVAELERRK